MNSVTFPAMAGGATFTDDSNATTGLAGGGHRVRFIPVVQGVVTLAADVVSKHGVVVTKHAEVVANATTVAGYVNAPLQEKSGASSKTILSNEAINAVYDNVGQVAASDLLLPTAFAGGNLLLVCGAATAYAWRVRAGVADKIYLNGVAGATNGYVGISTPVVGAYISLFSFKTGIGTYAWMAIVGNGDWNVL